MEFEYCYECDKPTGRAGRHDDSIYHEEYGPLCLDCLRVFEKGRESAEADAQAKIAELEAQLSAKEAEIDRLRASVRAVEIERDWEIDKKRIAIAGIERRDEELSAANNLLAVIHRDGGHYTGRVGFVKSCADAVEIFLAAVAKDKQEEGA